MFVEVMADSNSLISGGVIVEHFSWGLKFSLEQYHKQQCGYLNIEHDCL